jgi:EAL domain-containing protein (putative c-di-GMP-specific phosphodiesterase class I)
VLELTESLLVDHADQAAARMHELRALGVGFSLDDFGTGYSSMAYLKDLPLSELKIDRTFTNEILTDPSDAVIVRTMIGMARNLGLSMVAEGVETDEQLSALIEWGCDGFQGYLFSRPVPEAEFAVVMTTLLEAARPTREALPMSAPAALVGPATPRHAEPAKRGRKHERSR